MTAPLSVGQVSVEVQADVSKLAKDLKSKVEAAFKDLDFDKLIRSSLGNKPLKVKVTPDFDTSGIGEKVRSTRVPKVPVEVDPVLEQFRREVSTQVGALARTVNAKIPVGADTTGVRQQLGAELALIKQTLKAEVPTEPAGRREYEARLRAMVAAASRNVQAKIQVQPQAGGGGGSLLSGLASALQGIASGAANAAQGLSDVGQRGQLVGAAATAASIAAAAVAAIGFAASAAVPLVFSLAGALASLPGLVAGAAAGFATLKLGFSGIADAFKKKPGGGGGGGGGGGESEAARARRIAAAERGVEAARRGIAAASRGLQAAQRGLVEAQESYTDALAAEKRAQEAVARARKIAAERIDDLGRSLRGAVLDEKEAQVELRDAARDLAAAQTTFNPELIADAELRYERAKLAVEEAADQVADLGEENADAAKKGVEGSDEVVQALRDQKDAQKAVRDAANGIVDAQDRLISANDAVKASYDSLASAQDSLAQAKERAAAAGGGGGGGVLDDTIKLAPEAQKFVDAIKALKPAFEALRLDVQNRLFAGLGTTVTQLANAWLPQLRTTLGSFADTFNRLAKNLARTISEPAFIKNIGMAAETARANLEKIGTVITGPLTTAFGNLAAASKPFIDAVGGAIASGLQQFADKVNAMVADGRLDQFFVDAAGYFNDLKDIAVDVGSILGSFFAILAGSEQTDKDSPFKQFKGFLDELATSLRDPQTRSTIRGYIEDFKNFANAVGNVVSFALKLYGALAPLGPISALIFGPMKPFYDLIKGLFAVDWSSIGESVKSGANEVGGAIWDGLKAGWEAVADVGSWIASKLWQGPDSLVGKVKSGLGIASPSRVFTQIGRDVIQGLLNGLTAMFGSLGATARTIPGRIRDAVGNAGAVLVQKGRDFVTGLRNGISGMSGSLSSTAAGLRSRVTSGLGQVGSLLYGAGQAIVSGLISGIRSMIGSLGSYLGSVGQFIKDNKGPIEKDRRLLIPEGAAIMEGLIAGIASRRGQLGTELGGVSEQISSSIVADPYGIYAQAEAAFSAGMTLSAPPPPLLAWAADATGDQVLDAFRGLIRIRYGGNTQAALGSGR